MEDQAHEIADLRAQVATLTALSIDAPAPRQITIVDEAGISLAVDVLSHDGDQYVVRLPEGAHVSGPQAIGEPLLVTIARLHAEVEQLRPLKAEHEWRGGVLAAVADALGEVSGVNGTGPGVDPWYYKARAALAHAGHHVPELREGHLAEIVQTIRDAQEAGSPFRPEAVAEDVLKIGRHHDLGLWEGFLAQDYPDAPTSAPAHLVNEICPRCQGYGGAPEMRRKLLAEVARRDRDIDHNAAIAESWKARHGELAEAAKTIAADNAAKDATIVDHRAKLTEHADALAQASKSLEDVVAHTREQADLIDAATAQRDVALDRVKVAEAQVAALAKALDAKASELADVAEKARVDAEAKAMRETRDRLDAIEARLASP